MIRPGRTVSALGAAFQNANVRRVELAWGAANVAEWAHFVALGVFAYEVGGTTAVGVAGLVRLLPAALLAPFAASLGDRFRRERFLLAIALVGSAALLGSAIAFFAGKNEVLIFAFAAFLGLATTLVRPALQALLPSLARTPEELVASNGATSTIESLGTLVGPLLAGVLVTLADVGVVFLVGAGAFLAAAWLLVRVRVEGRLEVSAEAKAQSTRRILWAGFRIVARSPRPRLVVSLILAQTFVRGCLNVLIVVAAFSVLDAGAGAVGYMTAAIGVGGLIGALWASTLRGRLAVPFGVALVFWGVPIALIAPWPSLAAALLMLLVVGAANSIEDVAAFTLIQRITPDEALTRVLGVLWGLAMGAVALGSIAAPAIVSAIGSRPAFVVVGAILPVVALVTYGRLVEIDRTVSGPAAELELIERVPMLAPLPLATKERIATSLVKVPVVADELVVRAGDPGDRFYIVAQGALEIQAPGLQATAHEGDYFGEIALLRDVPRTATIRATADSTLYALERDDFLAAVMGHTAARVAGESVVEERLSGMPSRA